MTDDEKDAYEASAIKDNGRLHLEGHIRIFDPETGEEFVRQRD